LKDLERQLHAALRDEEPVPVVAESLGFNPKRLAIYRRFTRGHVTTALALYPATRARLGSALWDRLTEAYRRLHPPSHWELNRAAEAFPAFLEARLQAGEPGLRHFDVCLAAVEWEQYWCMAHPAEIPEVVAAPTLNPTLALVEQPFAVIPWLLAHERGEEPSEPVEAPSLALFFRNPRTDGGAYFHGSDPLLFALKVVHGALSVAEGAAAAGTTVERAQAALDYAAEVGLILRP
jgi:hypothetical protein